MINIVETFQDFYDEEDALLVEFYSNDNHEKNNIIELIEILKENDYHAFYSTSEIRDGFIKDQIIYIYTSNNLTKDKLIYTKNINHLNFVSSKGFLSTRVSNTSAIDYIDLVNPKLTEEHYPDLILKPYQ